MKILSFLSLCFLALSATAEYTLKNHPHPEELSPALKDLGRIDLKKPMYKYLGNGKGQSRCGCPWLNVAANYGLLPYDGKNIHFETMRLVAYKGGFVDKLFSFPLGNMGKIVQKIHDDDVKAGKPNPHPLDRIDLWELGIHGPIEHDFSFSRWDVNLPDQDPNDRAVNPELVEQMLAKYSKHADGCYLDQDGLTQWRQDRREMEKKRNKRPDDYTNNIKQQFASTAEGIFTLYFLGRDGKISCDYVRSFFLEEKIPDTWQQPEQMPFPQLAPKVISMVLQYYAPSKAIEMAAKFKNAISHMFS